MKKYEENIGTQHVNIHFYEPIESLEKRTRRARRKVSLVFFLLFAFVFLFFYFMMYL